MSRLSKRFGVGKLMGASYVLMLAAVPVLFSAKPAVAFGSRVCECDDNYCEATGGSPYQKWCCIEGTETCGCTLFTNC